MKYCIVLGTRPEIIKFSPIIRELQKRKKDFFILHTNQHYSYEMDKIFFEQLELPAPKYNLEVGSGTQGQQTAKMLQRIEEVLEKETPKCVLVEGDTNTVLAGALAASKLEIPVAHVEAGLRSYDRRMPEEINRVMADHASNILFPPTEEAKKNLLEEGIGSKQFLTKRGFEKQQVFVVGNTAVDATLQNIELAEKKAVLPLKPPKEYALLTTHRAENVDDAKFLANLAEALGRLGMPVLAPLHPRTKKNLEKFRIKLPVTELPPIGYLEFLKLEKHARLVLTDSGGVQEEACTLGVPCVTLRKTTERPETIKAGANMLGKTTATEMLSAAQKMLRAKSGWKNPYGDGHAAEKIVEKLP